MKGLCSGVCIRLCVALAVFMACVAPAPTLEAQNVPRYNHVFVLIMENEGYNQVIGNQHAPDIRAGKRLPHP